MDAATFEVSLAKADFKFNCSHFIAFRGFRERLHGHNYRVHVKFVGRNNIMNDGYVIDFGDVKKILRNICKELNEYFIVPMKSDVLDIKEDGTQLCMTCEDGSFFSFPKGDCKMLPLYHSSAEELAHYIWCKIISDIGLEVLKQRHITTIEVAVAEAPQQSATFRNFIPTNTEALKVVQNYRPALMPLPCGGD